MLVLHIHKQKRGAVVCGGWGDHWKYLGEGARVHSQEGTYKSGGYKEMSSIILAEYHNSRQNIIILFWKYLVDIRSEYLAKSSLRIRNGKLFAVNIISIDTLLSGWKAAKTGYFLSLPEIKRTASLGSPGGGRGC